VSMPFHGFTLKLWEASFGAVPRSGQSRQVAGTNSSNNLANSSGWVIMES